MAEVIRSIKYDEHGEPYLCIQPKINPENYPPFMIPADSAWMYAYDKNPQFQKTVLTAVCWMFDRWNMGMITREKWTSVATVIEDGLDELHLAPPREQIIDVAVQQQMQEAMSSAVKNAEFDSRTNTVKMVVAA